MDFLISKKKLFSSFLNKRKGIHYISVILFMFIFVFPLCIQDSGLYNYFLGGQAAISLFSLIFLLPKHKKKVGLLILSLLIVLAAISFFTGNENFLIVLAFSIYCLGFIAAVLFLLTVDRDVFLKAISDYSFLMIVINAIISILFQDGMYYVKNASGHNIPVFFLGIGNLLTIYIIAFLAVIFSAYIILKKDGYKLPISIIMALIGVYFSSSSTGYIGLFVFAASLVGCYTLERFKLIEHIKKVRPYKMSIILLVFILVLHVLFTVVNIQFYFEPLIKALFDKNATFTNRTYIWDVAFKNIKKSPIYGYGAGYSHVFLKSSGNKFHAHNLFLEFTLIGGVLAFTAFCILLYFTFKNLFSIKNLWVRFITFSAVIAFFIMSITEVYSLNIIIFLLFMPMIFNKYFESSDEVVTIEPSKIN